MLQISLNQSEGTPIYFQLLRQIKHMIATGRLNSGDELPSVRVLAQQLLVNPNTIVRAYRELEAAGLIFSKRGSGTYVADGRIPYSQDECRRILSERLDAIVVEARSLGYSLEQVIELMKERDLKLKVDSQSDLSVDGSANGHSEGTPHES